MRELMNYPKSHSIEVVNSMIILAIFVATVMLLCSLMARVTRPLYYCDICGTEVRDHEYVINNKHVCRRCFEGLDEQNEFNKLNELISKPKEVKPEEPIAPVVKTCKVNYKPANKRRSK